MIDFGPWEASPPEARLALLAARGLVSDADEAASKGLLSQRPIDWVRFNNIISYHELSPSAYILLKRFPALLPREEFWFLKQQFYSNILRLSLLEQELVRILRDFNEHGIIALPLKGSHFLLDAGIYADKAYLRPMSDIDILVKKSDYHKAQVILESRGYLKEPWGRKEEYWRNKNYHLAFSKKNRDRISYTVEVHWDLDYPRDSRFFSLPRLWEKVIKTQRQGGYFFLSSPEDTLLSLALHQRRFGKMLLLKSACDVALLLLRHADTLDWDYLLREAREARMRTVLYFVLLQAETLFNIQMPNSALRAMGVSGHKKRLIRNFILKDTFGCGLDLNAPHLKAHFLLYDSFREPVISVLNVPQEQFAKFYRLPPYGLKTVILYRLRWFYFVKSSVATMYRTLLKRIKRI